MKYWVLFFSLFLSFTVAATNGEQKMKELFWYKGVCTEAQIDFTERKNKKTTTASKKITDASELKKITSLLDIIPTSGDIMISMAPPELYIELKLKCDSETYKIKVYDTLLQTPATSFGTTKPEEEKALVQLLRQYYKKQN